MDDDYSRMINTEIADMKIGLAGSITFAASTKTWKNLKGTSWYCRSNLKINLHPLSHTEVLLGCEAVISLDKAILDQDFSKLYYEKSWLFSQST